MGIFSFLKKKEEPLSSENLGINTDFSNDPINHNLSNLSNNNFQDYSHLEPSMNLSQPATQFPNQQFTNDTLQKDIQILSLKLDAIKSELDSINQRIKNIESIAEKEQMQQNKRWY